jgi:hypothetical protein
MARGFFLAPRSAHRGWRFQCGGSLKRPWDGRRRRLAELRCRETVSEPDFYDRSCLHLRYARHPFSSHSPEGRNAYYWI